MNTPGFILIIALLLSFSCVVALGQGPEAKTVSISSDEVVVSFITVNAYGNNLFLDNVSLGTQYQTDLAVSSINNIKPDTSYAVGASSSVISPQVTIVNVGKNDITTPFSVTFTATPGGYSSVRTLSSLPKGQGQELTFDNITIPPNTPEEFTVVSNLAVDQNNANDTLRQKTLILQGVQRYVLLEEWTSSTCGPCAANNPTIDAFVAEHFDSLIALKYHVGWPSPGNDPMYLHNPTQSYDRRYYYGVNSVPHVIMDGIANPSYPYSDPSSLPDARDSRVPIGTPISLAVTDTRLPGDTIRAEISITIHSPLTVGNYKLRVEAAERTIHYTSAPGSNGETDFFDVFRRAYPTTDGTLIPTSVGTYNYVFKYKIDTAVWIDSMIYTMVFVQNDLTKEVLNCAKARINTSSSVAATGKTSALGNIKDVCLAPDAQSQGRSFMAPLMGSPESGFNYEVFEGSFPAPGWRLVNPDGGITLAQYAGTNGPSLGGTNSIWIDFYSYSTAGRTDTLYSRVFTGLSTSDSLKFDWAHAQYPGYSDRLIVKVSTNGGTTFPTTVFDRSGASLATAGTSSNAFVPTSPTQWGRFACSLNGIVTPTPAAPVLTSPPNGSTDMPTALSLTWNASAGATSYRLQVSTNPLFVTLVIDDSTLTGTSRPVSGLTSLMIYYWRVCAVNPIGAGPWSNAWHFTTVSFVTNQYTMNGAWNLIGLPLTVSDGRKSEVFPTASSEAYSFNPVSGYVPRDTLINGTGYWLKFPTTQDVSISGFVRTRDTVEVFSGWNMIGSISVPVQVTAIQQVPPGILSSSFYGYSGSYAAADTLWPGKGYWVKSAAVGSIVLFPAAGQPAKPGTVDHTLIK